MFYKNQTVTRPVSLIQQTTSNNKQLVTTNNHHYDCKDHFFTTNNTPVEIPGLYFDIYLIINIQCLPIYIRHLTHKQARNSLFSSFIVRVS